MKYALLLCCLIVTGCRDASGPSWNRLPYDDSLDHSNCTTEMTFGLRLETVCPDEDTSPATK